MPGLAQSELNATLICATPIFAQSKMYAIHIDAQSEP